MNLYNKQLKHFRRIHKKHPVSLEFLKLNARKISKLVHYEISLHFLIKRRLVKRNNRVFICYNKASKQKFFNKPKERKHQRKRLNKILPWSKRMVIHLKKLYLLDKIKQSGGNTNFNNSDSQNPDGISLPPDEIQKQLKTQLELLKNGKRNQQSLSSTNFTSSLPVDNSLTNTNCIKSVNNLNENNRLSLDRKRSFDDSSKNSFNICLKDVKEAGPSNLKRSRNEIVQDFSNNSEIKLNELEKNVPIEFYKKIETLNQSPKKQKSFNFIDSLINKINSTNGIIMEAPIISTSPSNNNSQKNKIKCNVLEEDSLSSGDFLGFPDREMLSPEVPGMLPTPIVLNKLNCSHSAFVSEDLDNFMRENSLDKQTDNLMDFPKQKRVEEGLVCEGAVPPKLSMVPLPSEIIKPRTVAEKRIMLQKNKNIKYSMIENENSIYCELKKRARDCKTNVPLIKSIQKLKIPASRDLWKATSWLLTQNGNFYFQIANIDGIDCKLIGGYGDNKQKILSYQLSCPIKKELKNVTCFETCKDRNFLDTIRIRYDQKNEKKTNPKLHIVPDKITKSKNNNYKPGPLSSKCLRMTYEPNMGPSEIYQMPKIQLEVFPKLNRPLNDVVKSYLKMILPSQNITKAWAEFACSTLIEPISTVAHNKELNESNTKSFTFKIPYLNNQQNILVNRRIYNRKEKFEKIQTDDLEFRKIAKESNDPITIECANILSEIIDSVGIGLSEDSLIKNDPDIDYINKNEENSNLVLKEKNITVGNANIEKKTIKSNKKSGNPKSRLMSELKRLNATIIDAGGLDNNKEVKEEECTKEYCRLGCVCLSLSGPPTLNKHCKKPNCMIECSCTIGLIQTEDMNSGITSQDALMLRKKATARFAKMEREFSSTVVLTNNETLLINESQYERKRRCTKRYLNYTYESDNDLQIENRNEDISSANKKKKKNKKKLPPNKTLTYDDIVNVNESIIKQIKHCTINLCKLKHIDNIEKWCMIHCLYKCFCNCKDINGKPFIIKKDSDELHEEQIYSRKAKYSFDKNETEPTKSPSTTISTDLKRTAVSSTPREVQQENCEIVDYYEPFNEKCRRIMQVPKAYPKRNKRFSLFKIIHPKYKHFKENDKTNAMLNERIKTSELYRPTRAIIIRKSTNCRSILKPEIKQIDNKDLINSTNDDKSSFLKISSVISLNSTSKSLLKPKSTLTQTATAYEPQPVALISNKNIIQSLPQESNKELTDVILKQDIHNNVLKQLNYLVTKRMHDICKIQANDCKSIPNPVAELLHICPWRYFLQAYIECITHIWEVKVDNKMYFTCTMQNIMPFIKNAISVVNIKAIRKDNLPLFGKMLNAKIMNQPTSNLSILLAGHHDYWRILGMTKSNIDHETRGGIIKPTPQSHPFLSKKINKLYALMAKQRIDNIRDKMMHERKIQNATSSIDNNIDNNSNQSNNNSSTNIIENSSSTNIIENSSSTNIIENSSSTNIIENENRLLQMNIKIRKLTEMEIIRDKFIIPIGAIGNIKLTDYRWLVLDVVDDFSHILFVEQMECLTHNKIKIAFQRSQKESKMVRLAKVDGHLIDCYITKNDNDRIYLGPFDLNGNPQVVLYQNIDGKMMLREDFERIHNIKRNKSTTGFWLCRSNGKILFDMTCENKNHNEIENINMNNKEFPNHNLDDCDDNVDDSEEQSTDLSEILNVKKCNSNYENDTSSIKNSSQKLTDNEFSKNFHNLSDGGLISLGPGNYQIEIKKNSDIQPIITLNSKKSISKLQPTAFQPLENKKQLNPDKNKLIKKCLNNKKVDGNQVMCRLNDSINKSQVIEKEPEESNSRSATKTSNVITNSITSLPYNIPSFIKVSTLTTSNSTHTKESLKAFPTAILSTKPKHNIFKNVSIESRDSIDTAESQKTQNNGLNSMNFGIIYSNSSSNGVNENSVIKTAPMQKTKLIRPISPPNNNRPRTISGYYESNIPHYPKFGGMKKHTNYLIKSSLSSAVQLKSLVEVSKYLNNHVRKHSSVFKVEHGNISWTFLPFKKQKIVDPDENSNDNERREVTTLNYFKNQSVTLKPKVCKSKTEMNDVIVIDDDDDDD